MSLYLKYRPQKLEDIVGESHITDILLAQMQQQAFSHNYLLHGPRGTGKTSTARLLAKMVNCTTLNGDGNADLQNDPLVQLIDAGRTLDFVEIDAASHTGVDNIREEIIDKALYPPSQLKKKVYIIDEVHMLSKGAFNALLKIMEEPPKYLMFILATTEINKVPDTIISRCQVFNFRHHTIDDIVGYLKMIADKEGFVYEEDGLRLLAKLSGGAMRDAIKYLEQVSMLGTVDQKNVSQFLGVVADAVLERFIDLLRQRDVEKIFTYLDELVAGGVDMINFTKDLMLWFDEHFMEDPAQYAGLAQMCREIYTEAKRAPYPVLVYKTKLYLYLAGGHISQAVTPQAAPVAAATTQSPQSTKSTTVPDKQETTEQKVPSVAVEKTVATSGSMNLAELLPKIVAKVEKKMVQSILKQHASIKSWENGVLSVVIINEAFYNSIQKPETTAYVAEIASSLLGESVTMRWLYMSKEDFLQQAMQ